MYTYTNVYLYVGDVSTQTYTSRHTNTRTTQWHGFEMSKQQQHTIYMEIVQKTRVRAHDAVMRNA